MCGSLVHTNSSWTIGTEFESSPTRSHLKTCSLNCSCRQSCRRMDFGFSRSCDTDHEWFAGGVEKLNFLQQHGRIERIPRNQEELPGLLTPNSCHEYPSLVVNAFRKARPLPSLYHSSCIA